MIDSQLLSTFLDIALLITVLLIIPCLWRVMIGPSPTDRLQAIDTSTNLLIGIIVLLALVQDAAFIVDVGIALAAFAFVATIAISRYICEGRVF